MRTRDFAVCDLPTTICFACGAATFVAALAAASTARSKEPAKIRASSIERFKWEDGVKIKELTDGLVTVHPDGSLTGTGKYRRLMHRFRPKENIRDNHARVELTGTFKDNRVAITCSGFDTEYGFVSGITLVAQLVDGKFHGVTHKTEDWSLTVILELIGGGDDTVDQDVPDEPDTTTDDAPLEPIPDTGDDDKPSEEFCARCARVEETLDKLESELAQFSAQLDSLHADLAGLQGEVGAWKKTLKHANNELNKAKVAKSEMLIYFWQGQIDKAHAANKRCLTKLEAKKKEIENLKKTWTKNDQLRLDSYREQWAKIRDQCAKCKQ